MKTRLLILAAILATGAVVYGGPIFAQFFGSHGNPNLVGWWKLDGNGTDSSGNNNTGTLVGSPTNAWDHNSTANSALGFDGATQYISITNAAGLDIAARPLTLMLWCRPTTLAAYNYLFARNASSSATMQYGLYMTGSGTAYFILEGDVRVQTFGYVPSNQWTHVACVWDSSGKPSIYTNAVLSVTNAVYTGALTSRANTSIACRSSAADGSTSIYFFPGQLDDVRVYKQALTTAEITTAMNGGQP